MNTIAAELAELEDGSVAVSSADVEDPPPREGDGDWVDSVVVWNGMVARVVLDRREQVG